MTRTRRVAALTAVLLAAAAALATGMPAAQAVDGPGSYFLARSQATGNPPKAEDDAKCNAYLGFPHSAATLQRLDAVLHAPVVDTSGLIINGTAAPVAPAHLCGALGSSGGLVESYARTTIPTVGPVELAGPCDLAPSGAQLGSALAQCRLAPVAGSGTPPAVVATNSVLNPFNSTGAQTGSLITAYFPGSPATNDGPPATAPAKLVPGASFRVLRAASSTSAAGADCPIGWKARTTTVKTAQVARATGRVLPATGPNAGTVTTCYAKAVTSGTVPTRAVLRIGSTTARFEGSCRHATVPGTTALAQTCGLWLRSPFGTVQDGLLNGSLLVPAGNAAGSADSGVWTVTTLTTT